MKKIKLTQNKYTLVDDEDFKKLNQFKWFARKDSKSGIFYVARNSKTIKGKRHMVHMHREIMNVLKNIDIDHKDGNGLNNQKNNLRLATRSQNNMNQKKRKDNISGFKGVSWRKDNKKWRTNISVEGKTITIGYFKTALEASKAYIKACIKYHGKFANY